MDVCEPFADLLPPPFLPAAGLVPAGGVSLGDDFGMPLAFFETGAVGTAGLSEEPEEVCPFIKGGDTRTAVPTQSEIIRSTRTGEDPPPMSKITSKLAFS
jgi:hypothetical protein